MTTRAPGLLAAALLLGATGALAGEPAPERFLVYKVERIAPEQAPKIDGRLDEAAWKDKAALATLRNFRGPLSGELATQATELTILSDGAKLYLGATFHDTEMDKLSANPANAPFWNDCIELYIDPRHDRSQHIQLVVDCLGRKFWHKKFDKGYGWWDDPGWYMLAKWDAAAERGAKSWSIELALDAASFEIDLTPGRVAGFNACRFRLGAEPQEFSAWGFGTEARQKEMSAWGHLLFGPPGQSLREAPLSAADIAAIYPDLGARVLEYPLPDGFLYATQGGLARRTFLELAARQKQELDGALEQARLEAQMLPVGDPAAPDLQKALEESRKGVEALQPEFAAGDLTLGRYDKLAAGAQKLREQLDRLAGKARLAALAAAAQAQAEDSK
ncbi:MAG: hypothetical protein M5U26_25045 [Planctomycetota bacterium]|nr:hypothetical protein [Planctomycetota bacterium]